MKAVVVFDQDKSVYTAFLKDFPSVVVQSRDLETLKEKLNTAWKSFLKVMEKRNIQLAEPINSPF